MLQDNLIKFFEESFKEHSDAPAITDYNPPFQNYNDFSGYFKVFP